MGYNHYPDTRIFISSLIKLKFCPRTVTRSTLKVPPSHIDSALYRSANSLEDTKPISTFTVASAFLHLRKLTFYFQRFLIGQ